MSNKEFHPVANIFPLISGQEFEALVLDIKKNGLIEPIWLHPDGRIIDGRNRYNACLQLSVKPEFRTYSGDSLVEFVISANLRRRHLSAGQKAAVALEAEPLLAEEAKQRQLSQLKQGDTIPVKERIPERDKGQARDQAAALLNTNGRYVQDLKAVGKEDPDLLEKVKDDEITVPESKALLKVEKPKRDRITAKMKEKGVKLKAAARAVEREIKEETLQKVDVPWLLIGDFREIGKSIPDTSVDLIFTDPPYDKSAVNLYGALAEFGKRVLKPGGLCLTYSGQLHLPDILSLMREHLEYMWLCGIGHSGSPTWFKKWNLDNQWKPLIMMGKPPINPFWNKFDDFATGQREKFEHHWQQAEAEATHYLKALCVTGGTICDPFLGGGTTLVAAKKLGLRFLGIEKDEVTAMSAQKRINDAAT